MKNSRFSIIKIAGIAVAASMAGGAVFAQTLPNVSAEYNTVVFNFDADSSSVVAYRELAITKQADGSFAWSISSTNTDPMVPASAGGTVANEQELLNALNAIQIAGENAQQLPQNFIEDAVTAAGNAQGYTTVDGVRVKERIVALETDVATKANQSDLNATNTRTSGITKAVGYTDYNDVGGSSLSVRVFDDGTEQWYNNASAGSNPIAKPQGAEVYPRGTGIRTEGPTLVDGVNVKSVANNVQGIGRVIFSARYGNPAGTYTLQADGTYTFVYDNKANNNGEPLTGIQSLPGAAVLTDIVYNTTVDGIRVQNVVSDVFEVKILAKATKGKVDTGFDALGINNQTGEQLARTIDGVNTGSTNLVEAIVAKNASQDAAIAEVSNRTTTLEDKTQNQTATANQTNFAGNVTVAGDTTIDGKLTVNGGATFKGNVLIVDREGNPQHVATVANTNALHIRIDQESAARKADVAALSTRIDKAQDTANYAQTSANVAGAAVINIVAEELTPENLKKDGIGFNASVGSNDGGTEVRVGVSKTDENGVTVGVGVGVESGNAGVSIGKSVNVTENVKVGVGASIDGSGINVGPNVQLHKDGYGVGVSTFGPSVVIAGTSIPVAGPLAAPNLVVTGIVGAYKAITGKTKAEIAELKARAETAEKEAEIAKKNYAEVRTELDALKAQIAELVKAQQSTAAK